MSRVEKNMNMRIVHPLALAAAALLLAGCATPTPITPAVAQLAPTTGNTASGRVTSLTMAA